MTVGHFLDTFVGVELPRLRVVDPTSTEVPKHPAAYWQIVMSGPILELMGWVLTSKGDGDAFDAAVKQLLPNAYHTYRCPGKATPPNKCAWKDLPLDASRPTTSPCLYHSWRCKGIHHLKPFGVAFGELRNVERHLHLRQRVNGSLLLIAELLVEDVIEAQRELKRQAEVKPEIYQRLSQPHFWVG